MLNLLVVFHQWDRISSTVCLKIWGEPPKDRKTEGVDYPSKINGGALVLSYEFSEVICPLIRTLGGFGVVYVRIFRR